LTALTPLTSFPRIWSRAYPNLGSGPPENKGAVFTPPGLLRQAPARRTIVPYHIEL